MNIMQKNFNKVNLNNVLGLIGLYSFYFGAVTSHKIFFSCMSLVNNALRDQMKLLKTYVLN